MEQIIQIDLNSDAFDYAGTFQIKSVVDWDKLQYNSTYKSPEYFRNKFPLGFEYLNGFEEIIQNMANKAKTPYEEMMSRGVAPTIYPDLPTASGIAKIILSTNINNDKSNIE
jgi:hypothetical protein